MEFLFVLEFLAIAFIGRHVVLNDAPSKTWGLLFAGAFLIGDLLVGEPIGPTVAARLASVPLLIAHFAAIQRFSGIIYLLALVFGATIPALVSLIRNAVAGG